MKVILGHLMFTPPINKALGSTTLTSLANAVNEGRQVF